MREVIGNSGKLKIQRMQKCPALKPRRKVSPLNFANTHVTWDTIKWSTVVFSDKKRFNLDGPDGFGSYLHGLRIEPRIFSTRQNGCSIIGSTRTKFTAITVNDVPD